MIARTFINCMKPAFALRTFASAAYALPPLPYARDALAPVISESTMKCHYDGHHQTYDYLYLSDPLAMSPILTI